MQTQKSTEGDKETDIFMHYSVCGPGTYPGERKRLEPVCGWKTFFVLATGKLPTAKVADKLHTYTRTYTHTNTHAHAAYLCVCASDFVEWDRGRGNSLAA